jgi:hypothetical protein
MPSRRLEGAQSGLTALASVGAALLVPSSLVTTAGVLVGWLDRIPDAADAAWTAYMLLPVRSSAIMGVLLLLLVVGVVAPRSVEYSH